MFTTQSSASLRKGPEGPFRRRFSRKNTVVVLVDTSSAAWQLLGPNSLKIPSTATGEGSLYQTLHLEVPPHPNTPCMAYMPTLTPQTTPIDRQSYGSPISRVWVRFRMTGPSWHPRPSQTEAEKVRKRRPNGSCNPPGV